MSTQPNRVPPIEVSRLGPGMWTWSCWSWLCPIPDSGGYHDTHAEALAAALAHCAKATR